MIEVTNNDTGKKVWLNPNLIQEINNIHGANGSLFSRIYMSTGHRTFMDVTESVEELIRRIHVSNNNSNGTYMIDDRLGDIEKAIERMQKEIVKGIGKK